MLDALFHFLFFTFIGWWILIVFIAFVTAPLVPRVANWRRRRRFMRSEQSKLANPQNADARFQLARIFYDGRKWRRTEDKIREAIRIADESPLYETVPHKFHVLLGDTLYRRKRYPEAVEAYEASLKAKSELGYGEVYLGLGRCALRVKEADKALTWLRKSVEERTSYLETYFRLAQAAALLEKPEEIAKAREEFMKTAANLPRFARQKKLRWKLAFLTFPLSRHLV